MIEAWLPLVGGLALGAVVLWFAVNTFLISRIFYEFRKER